MIRSLWSPKRTGPCGTRHCTNTEQEDALLSSSKKRFLEDEDTWRATYWQGMNSATCLRRSTHCGELQQALPLVGLQHTSPGCLALQTAANSLFPFLFSVPCADHWEFLLAWESKQTENKGDDSLLPLFIRRRGKMYGERKGGERGRHCLGPNCVCRFLHRLFL